MRRCVGCVCSVCVCGVASLQVVLCYSCIINNNGILFMVRLAARIACVGLCVQPIGYIPCETMYVFE